MTIASVPRSLLFLFGLATFVTICTPAYLFGMPGPEQHEPLPPIPELSRYLAHAVSPDRRWVVTLDKHHILGEPNFFIDLWEIMSEKDARRVGQLHAGYAFRELCSAGFSPDGRSVVAGDEGGEVRVWDCETRQERLRFAGGNVATYAPDGRSILALSLGGQVRRFDALTGRPVPVAPGTGPIHMIYPAGAAFAPGWERVAVWDGRELLVQEGTTGKFLFRMTFPRGCGPASFSPDGRVLTVVVGTGGSRTFDAATGRELGGRKEEKPERRAEADQPLTDPPWAPFEIELIARKQEYVLDRGGRSTDEFCRQFVTSRRNTPAVDLELRLRYTGADTVSFPDVKPKLFLAGPGALNIITVCTVTQLPCDGGGPFPEPELLMLSPGQTYTLPVNGFDCDPSIFWHSRSHWVLPGEYLIYASCDLDITTGVRDGVKRGGYVTVHSVPVKVRVVEANQEEGRPVAGWSIWHILFLPLGTLSIIASRRLAQVFGWTRQGGATAQ